jgi:predicted short-subunit dehydrogenase-like oxidoreductase (DUF2520 family)
MKDVVQNEGDPSFRPLILGGGRCARHLLHFLTLKGVHASIYPDTRGLLSALNRSETDASFSAQALQYSHLWLAVSDQALIPLAETVSRAVPGLPLIHSSAATEVPGALTLHPLMTFSRELYSEGEYDRIPLVLFQEELNATPHPHRSPIETLMRQLSNPVKILSSSERTSYHLSCVFYSNLSLLLWEAASRVTPSKLSPVDYRPILEQTLHNFFKTGLNALTGPLVRGDQVTLRRHLASLQNRPECSLYEGFTEYFKNLKKEPQDDPSKAPESTPGSMLDRP